MSQGLYSFTYIFAVLVIKPMALPCWASTLSLSYIPRPQGSQNVSLFVTWKENRGNVLFLSFRKWISEINIFLRIFALITYLSSQQESVIPIFQAKRLRHVELKGLDSAGLLWPPWTLCLQRWVPALWQGMWWWLTMETSLLLLCGGLPPSPPSLLEAIFFNMLTKPRLLGKHNRIS